MENFTTETRKTLSEKLNCVRAQLQFIPRNLQIAFDLKKIFYYKIRKKFWNPLAALSGKNLEKILSDDNKPQRIYDENSAGIEKNRDARSKIVGKFELWRQQEKCNRRDYLKRRLDLNRRRIVYGLRQVGKNFSAWQRDFDRQRCIQGLHELNGNNFVKKSG